MRSNERNNQAPERVDKPDDLNPKSELSFLYNLLEKISHAYLTSQYSKLIGWFIGAVATVALALAFPLTWINLGVVVATGCGVGVIEKIKTSGSFFEGFTYGIIGSIALTSFLSLVVPHMLSALVFYGIFPAPFVAPILAAWPLIQTILPMVILAGGTIAEYFKPEALISTFDFLSSAIVKLTALVTTTAGRMISAVGNRCCPKEDGQQSINEGKRGTRGSTATYMPSGERPGEYPRVGTATERLASRQDQPARERSLSEELNRDDKQPPLETTSAPRSPTFRG